MQEEENAEYVTRHGAGTYAEEPEKIVEILRQWLVNPALLERMSKAAGALARPRAAIETAEAVYRVASTKPIINRAPQNEPLLARIDRLLGL